VDENPYQSPATLPAGGPQRRSFIRLVLTGFCFLAAVILVVIVGKGIDVMVSAGLDSPYGVSALVLIAWGSLNVISCGLVGVGLFRRRLLLTGIGGSILVLSTVVLAIVSQFLPWGPG
jgi:hypothetical protein